MLDSAILPATCTSVRQGDGLTGQPSETVGGPNLRVLISSLDGDRDFRCLMAPSPPALPYGSCNRHETSPRTNSADGLPWVVRIVVLGVAGFAGQAQIRSNA